MVLLFTFIFLILTSTSTVNSLMTSYLQSLTPLIPNSLLLLLKRNTSIKAALLESFGYKVKSVSIYINNYFKKSISINSFCLKLFFKCLSTRSYENTLKIMVDFELFKLCESNNKKNTIYDVLYC